MPDGLEPQLAAALDELRRRLTAGGAAVAEDFRDSYPAVWGDDDAALELVYAEYVLRAGRGDAPDRADWYRRFPQLRDRLERLFAIYDLAGADTNPSLLDTDPTGPRPVVGPVGHPDGYELLAEVGRGGMGVVYKARQLDLNRVVAVKMLRGGPLVRDEDVERLRREAEAVARLQHPNIVQIHGVGEFDGVPFLCLEYVAGGSLADALTEAHRPGRPGVAAADAARLVEVLARAIHVAHAAGVVHRDLKPANVLLVGARGEGPGAREEGASELAPDPSPLATAKITDFGLAALAEFPADATRTGAIVGTPCYMAPEQAAADRSAVGPRTDVYALGGVLYHALTGRPPFEGATALETLDQVRTTDPIPPRRLRPSVPRDLETICLTCLRKEPAKRYATAELLADDLRRFLDGEPVVARPVSAAARGVKWARRRPAVAALVVVVAALVVTSFGLLWSKYEDAEAARLAEQKHLGEKLALAESARETEHRQRVALERTLARQWVDRARNAYQDNKTADARGFLDRCAAEYRDADWEALRRECHAEVASQNMGRTSAPTTAGGIAASRDGGQLAVYAAPYGTSVSFRDAGTGALVMGVAVQGKGGLMAADFTPNGRRLVLVPAAGTLVSAMFARTKGTPPADTVQVMDLASKRIATEWPLGVHHLVTKENVGRRIAAYSGRRVRVWEAETGRSVAEFPMDVEDNMVLAIAVSPDGERVAVLAQGVLRAWDIPTGREFPSAVAPAVGWAWVGFTPDGAEVVWLPIDPGSTRDKTPVGVAVWSLAEGRERFRVLRPPTFRGPIAVGRRFLAVADESKVLLLDRGTGNLVATLRGHAGAVQQLAFSGDDRRLYSTSSDVVLKVWDVTPWHK